MPRVEEADDCAKNTKTMGKTEGERDVFDKMRTAINGRKGCRELELAGVDYVMLCLARAAPSKTHRQQAAGEEERGNRGKCSGRAQNQRGRETAGGVEESKGKLLIY
jgi:hypothetical protein